MNEYVSPSIFDEIEKERPFFEYAGTWLRMLNLVIDSIAFIAFYFIVLVIILVTGDMVNNNTDALEDFLLNDISTATITLVCLYVLFYTLQETFLKGRTMGKLITKTCAVKRDMGTISFKDALLRSAVRLLPFEVFSGFTKRVWHDQLSRTMVIKKGKRASSLSPDINY